MSQCWGLIKTPLGWQAGSVDGEGALTGLYFVGRSTPSKAQIGRWLSIESMSRNDAALAPVQRQVTEYFGGERQRFDLPLAAKGTAFQHQVWGALQKIPFGATETYGGLAAKLGRPKAARAVGRANATNPISLVVPCHRVIGSDGTLTGYAGGIPVKQALLALEAKKG